MPPATITRAEFDALAKAVQALTEQLQADRTMLKQTHEMVVGLHRALVEPEPGQEYGLLHRMAVVTIAAETGQAAGERIIWLAKVLGAAGLLVSSFWAAIRFGHTTGK